MKINKIEITATSHDVTFYAPKHTEVQPSFTQEVTLIRELDGDAEGSSTGSTPHWYDSIFSPFYGYKPTFTFTSAEKLPIWRDNHEHKLAILSRQTKWILMIVIVNTYDCNKANLQNSRNLSHSLCAQQLTEGLVRLGH